MKLGILLDRFDENGGGAERHTARLVGRALEAGDAVVLATLDGLAPEGAEGIRIAAPRRRPARDRVFAAEGTRRLRSAGADVVLGVRHCPGVDVYLPHGGLYGDATAAWDAARGGSGAWRRFVRALSAKAGYFLEAERQLLGGFDGPAVICVSDALARRMRAAYPASAGRVVVVPNGVDAEHFEPARFGEVGAAARHRLGLDGRYVALLLAHHPRLKGAATAISAMARPEVRKLDPALHLVVAGGALDVGTRRLARRRGVSRRVHEIGPATEPRFLYAAADVLAHPTYYDPCSLACLEALAMALPVVTTPANGVLDLMGDRGGIVIDAPGSDETLAAALCELADPERRSARSATARAVALEHPLQESLDRVLDVCRLRQG